jgi:two-component system sensor histidine kinase UhpB
LIQEPDSQDDERRRSFAAQILETQEAELRRLARELHDDLGQRVTALKMELARIDPGPDPKNAERLSRAGEIAQGVLSTIRNISSMLHPIILNDLGLKSALNWHIQKFYERTEIPCTLLCSLQEPDDLKESVRLCIYRIVQEALNNSEKYASATRIHITVERRDAITTTGDVIVTIADDGRGFRPSAIKPGASGIRGMKERAALVGGTIKIDSSEGNGTAVVLTIPVEKLEKSEVTGASL